MLFVFFFVGGFLSVLILVVFVPVTLCRLNGSLVLSRNQSF